MAVSSLEFFEVGFGAPRSRTSRILTSPTSPCQLPAAILPEQGR